MKLKGNSRPLSNGNTIPLPASRNLHARALLLAYLTIGYNVLEGLISLLAGYWAGSIALTGFGLDSFVESLSGIIMVWRFTAAGKLPPAAEAARERRAVRLVGYTFFILAAYVLYESAHKLIFQEPPSPSLLGLIIAGISLLLMPALFAAKYRLGRSLGSQSLMADAKQTLACAWLSLALLVGLGLNYLYGFWQADPIMGLIIVIVLLREGKEALGRGALCSCCSLPCRTEEKSI